jgi:uncharacterized protein YuzE
MVNPSVEWDKEANAAYLAFRPIAAGEATEQVTAKNRDGEIVAVLDFAENGELLGIELLDAAAQLPGRLRISNKE